MTGYAKRVVELTVLMVVEVNPEWDEGMVKFHFEENHCKTNLINALNRAVEFDGALQTCNLCSVAGVQVMPKDFPLSDAFDPERPEA